MNRLRRDGLVFAAAMGATSLLSAVSAPKRVSGPESEVGLELLFPATFEQWKISGAMNAFVRPTDQPVYRIYDQVLERTYVHSGERVVMLSVAYGATQSGSLQLHRPEVCYRHNGFKILGARTDDLRTSKGLIPVNRLLAERPGRQEAITYWTILGGEIARDAHAFRILSLSFAVRRQIVDGILVRVSSIDPLPERAYALHDDFIVDLVGTLPAASRAQVFGRTVA